VTRVLVIGVGEFDGHGDGGSDDADPLAPANTLEPLPSVGPAVAGLAAQLARMPGLSVLGGDAALDPGLGTLTDLWRGALRQAQGAAGGEALLVHFAGHGVPGPGDHTLFLAARETTRRDLPWTAAQVGTWLGEAEAVVDGPPVLLLLDVCGAGRPVVQQVLDGIRAEDRRVWIIAACAPEEKTYQARFTVATGTVLERLRQGQLDISPAMEHVPVETLAREIDRELARSAAAEDRPSQSVLRTTHPEARAPVPPFLVNPSYRATAGGQFRQAVDLGLWQFATAVDPALDPLHFISRASGTPQPQDIAQGCFFTGRSEQLRVIKQWLEGPSEQSLMIVTGSPGAGKSALLGVVACLAHPQLREVSRQVAGAVSRDVRPELDPCLVAVHARQRGPAEVLASIAAQLGLDTAGRAWSVTALLNRIAEKCSRPVTVMVDALDEASVDMALVEELRQLADGRRRFDATFPGRDLVLCRVLIGTRPWWDRYAPLIEDLADEEQLAGLDHGRPWWERYEPLLEDLEAKGLLVDLDSISDEQRSTELADYLCDVLETSRVYSGPGTAEVRQATARSVAGQLGANHASGAFLLASLFAHYLVHQETAPSVEEVVKKVPASLPDMLELHLDVLEKEHPAMSAVLAAVAHGYGQGMPLEVVHSVAQAFVAPGDRAPDLDDVRGALSTASFYLRFSTDTDGQRLYRFYHQSLVDHLRHAHRRVSRADIFTRVLDTVPGPAELTARRFGLALPYVLRHAAQHAADAGAVDALLLSASFLVHCDPLLLLEHTNSHTTVRGLIAAEVSRAALSAAHEPWQRRAWLRNTAAVWDERWLVEALDALEEPTVQRPRPAMLDFVWGTTDIPAHPDLLSRWNDFSPVLVRGGQRWLAIARTDSEELLVRDVRTGMWLFSLHVPEGSPPEVLCGGYGDFGSLVAGGTSAGRVVVWNADTGRVRLTIETEAIPLTALSIVEQQDQAYVVVCGGGEVTAYDLAGSRVASLDILAGWLTGLETGTDVTDLFEPDTDIPGYDCTAVAGAELDGDAIIVAGGVDGALHVWHPDSRKHIVWPGGREPITSLQVLAAPGRPIAVTGAEDGTRAWDLRTGTSRLLTGVKSPNSGALVLHDGTPCIAHLEPGIGVRAQPLDAGPTMPRAACVVPQRLTDVSALATDGTSWAAVGSTRRRFPLREQVVLLSQYVHNNETMLLSAVWHSRLVERVAVARTVSYGLLPAVSVDEGDGFHVWDALTGRALWSGERVGVSAVRVGLLAGKNVVVLSHGFGAESRVEFLAASTGRPVRTAHAPLETVEDMSIDDTGDVTHVVLRTRSGVSAVALDESGQERILYEEDVDDEGLTYLSAWQRRGHDDVVVTARSTEKYLSPWESDTVLTVHSVSGPDLVLAELVQTLTTLTIGRWHDDDAVVSGDEAGHICVLDLETGEELAGFRAHVGAVASMAFIDSAEGPLLVTSGEDNWVRVWDPRAPDAPQDEIAFPDTLGCAAVSQAGVFAGFATQVAFFTWTSPGGGTWLSEEAGNE
jgi:WD40 repeat protein